MRMIKPGIELAKKHYAPAAASLAKADLAALVNALAPGPAIAMLWRAPNAIATLRVLVGDESPARALPGTVRGDFSSVASADPLVELGADDADSTAAANAKSGGAASAGKFYITTAINYANGPPHMGHAYEAIAADVIARYHRGYGRDVFFLTGADEHGQKIADTATKEGMKPIELCDKHVAQFIELDRALGCEFNGYVRTTSDKHKNIARKLWSKCESAGGVYLGVYAGWYNVREETFVTETDAAANDYKDPMSGVPLKKMEEPSYFFKLSEYRERLIEHIQQHPEFIVPESRRNEVLERLAVPLMDLSVSRTTFDWGISVPGSTPGHVMYVWFDALSNYISGIGYDPLAGKPAASSPTSKFWPADVHLIGKDIIWFHCVIWPALLMCAELPLPKTILAHGFVHGSDGRKMSKSLNNVVNPYDVLEHFPVDSFRYFLMRDATFGTDVTFSETSLALRHNSELADTYGNLVNRSLALCNKYNAGKVPSNVADQSVLDVAELRRASEAAYASHQIDVAAGLAMSALHAANKYLTDTEPWHLKAGDPLRLVIVRTVLEIIYVATHFLAPFLVDGSRSVFERLNTPPRPIASFHAKLDHLSPGTQTTVGGIMYNKVETKEALEKQAAEAAAKKEAIEAAAKKKAAKASADAGAGATQSELSKLNVLVGKIISVERHPDADALYVEKIDLGGAAPRQVVSGLVKHIPIEQMGGRRVVVLANLKPSKLKGVESQAMVLCGKAADGSKMELIEPPEGVPVGERITFAGHDGEPEAQLNPKKKVWEKLMPSLNTSESCVARFETTPFMTSKGACTVQTIANGAIG